jgi:hypothetical protein
VYDLERDGCILAIPLPCCGASNLVATVNLGCRLDLRHIALHARNAEYAPKVGQFLSISASQRLGICPTGAPSHPLCSALCCSCHEDTRAAIHCLDLCEWQTHLHWHSKVHLTFMIYAVVPEWFAAIHGVLLCVHERSWCIREVLTGSFQPSRCAVTPDGSI